MTFSVTTPASSDRYSLTSDLRVMADDIESYLNTIAGSAVGAVQPGSSPTLNSITTTSTSTFPSIILSGLLSQAYILNDANGFGFKVGSVKLTTDGTSWTSTGHVNVPSGPTGTQAVNKNVLDSVTNPLDSRITILEESLTGITGTAASESYVDNKIATVNTNIASLNSRLAIAESNVAKKANYAGAVNRVDRATIADNAAHSNYSDNATNATKINNRRPVIGSFNAGTLAAGSSSTRTITHNLGYIPGIFATAVGDTGVVSIICSTGSVGTNTAQIKYKNVNSNKSETFWINWMAI